MSSQPPPIPPTGGTKRRLSAAASHDSDATTSPQVSPTRGTATGATSPPKKKLKPWTSPIAADQPAAPAAARHPLPLARTVASTRLQNSGKGKLAPPPLPRTPGRLEPHVASSPSFIRAGTEPRNARVANKGTTSSRDSPSARFYQPATTTAASKETETKDPNAPGASKETKDPPSPSSFFYTPTKRAREGSLSNNNSNLPNPSTTGKSVRTTTSTSHQGPSAAESQQQQQQLAALTAQLATNTDGLGALSKSFAALEVSATTRLERVDKQLANIEVGHQPFITLHAAHDDEQAEGQDDGGSQQQPLEVSASVQGHLARHERHHADARAELRALRQELDRLKRKDTSAAKMRKDFAALGQDFAALQKELDMVKRVQGSSSVDKGLVAALKKELNEVKKKVQQPDEATAHLLGEFAKLDREMGKVQAEMFALRLNNADFVRKSDGAPAGPIVGGGAEDSTPSTSAPNTSDPSTSAPNTRAPIPNMTEPDDDTFNPWLFNPQPSPRPDDSLAILRYDLAMLSWRVTLNFYVQSRRMVSIEKGSPQQSVTDNRQQQQQTGGVSFYPVGSPPPRPRLNGNMSSEALMYFRQQTEGPTSNNSNMFPRQPTALPAPPPTTKLALDRLQSQIDNLVLHVNGGFDMLRNQTYNLQLDWQRMNSNGNGDGENDGDDGEGRPENRRRRPVAEM